MYTGFRRCLDDDVDIVINADGDTYLDPDAVASAVRLFERRPEVVCMTGDVRVANAAVNRLTLLTSLRYFYAFNVERAAQSLYGQMTCLSGPFLAIRAKNLALILEDWYNQEFLGVRCTYGDDRHMTTLCIQRGWVSVYNPDVIVWTDAPTSYKVWKKQQRRWSRSGWRENYLLLKKGYERLHPFVQFDLFYLTFFPFLVLGVLIAVIANAVVTTVTVSLAAGIIVVVPYMISILLMSVVFQSLYGLILTGDRRFLLSTFYLYLWLRYLIVIKAQSLTELRNPSWETK
jgi:hyaluronan synthase